MGNLDSSWVGNGTLQDLLNNQRDALRNLAEGPPGSGPIGNGNIIGDGVQRDPNTGLHSPLNNGGRGNYAPEADADDGTGDYRNALGNFWGAVGRMSGAAKAGLNALAGANQIANVITLATGQNPDGTKANKIDKGFAFLGLVPGGNLGGALRGPLGKLRGKFGKLPHLPMYHGPTCFPAGTKVAVKRSNSQTSTIQDDVVVVDEQQIAYVPIEQIQEGDTVVSRDEQTGKTLYKRVAQTFSRTSDHLITLALADSKTGNVVETIQTTRNHPFYVDSKGWIPAGGLAIGNSIVTRAGPTLVIKNIEWERRAEGYKVYNFEVEDTHSYFVGTATGGAWVHNYNGLDFLGCTLSMVQHLS